MLLKLILRRRRLLVALVLAICTALLSIFINVQFSTAELGNSSELYQVRHITHNKNLPPSPRIRISVSVPTMGIQPETILPPLKVHPLPSTLEQWQDSTGSGDYFSQVKPTNLGYLVWSEFPLKVYVERPLDTAGTSASARRFQQWVEAVLQPVQEWSVYLPLVVVEQRENADIAILRSRPPLRPSFKRDTGELQLPPARSAETHYEFYIRQAAGTPAVLYHRCNILLSPDLSNEYIKAAGRHELGHALGIWGHSPLETDAMYFAQVRNPPPISSRDINTLKRVYEQPTRVGWLLPGFHQ